MNLNELLQIKKQEILRIAKEHRVVRVRAFRRWRQSLFERPDFP